MGKVKNNKILLSFISLLFLSFLPSLSNALETESSFLKLPLLNKTFSYAGPNCFGSALYGAGVYEHIRGVDVGEFSHVLKTSCSEVKTPETGDIGVYEVSDFAPIHAFMYLNEEVAYEKQGVDYVGATPIRLIALSDLKYRAEADVFCRRYGDESCHNKLKYFRCSYYEKPSQLLELEGKIELMIRGLKSFSADELLKAYEDLKSLESLDESLLVSLSEQLKFIFGSEVFEKEAQSFPLS